MRHGARKLRNRAWGMLGRLCQRAAFVCAIVVAGTVVHAADDIVVPRDFSTIQAAVNAAAPGATIKVRSGTYTEQVVIAKNVTLKGAGVGETVIEAPATLATYAVDTFSSTPVAAIVRITDGAHVRMSGFTVTGPTPCFGTSGVVAVKGSTLELRDSRATLIEPADSGCLTDFRSFAVLFGLPFFIQIDGEADGGSIGHGTVTNVAIDRFLTFGIAVRGPFAGPPSTATIKDNVVTGGTPFAVFGQGGITMSFAAVARVTGNTVSGMVCTGLGCGPDPINDFQSIGISGTSNPPGTVIEKNTVIGNDVGIYLFGNDGCCRTRENTLTDNRFFGIAIQDGTGETAENRISGGEVGIGVIADFVDTVAVLRHDRIKQTSVAPVQEIECCGVTATAIVKP